jgi:hypothetical protein
MRAISTETAPARGLPRTGNAQPARRVPPFARRTTVSHIECALPAGLAKLGTFDAQRHVPMQDAAAAFGNGSAQPFFKPD